MFDLVRYGLMAGALLCAPSLAHAQSPSAYPDRPIRLVVAFVPGGATDTLTRQLTEDLKEALGQPVIIENRPGANGYLAWNHVASSEPDGYTLLMAENALGISQGLFKKSASSFDPLTQYDAIAGVAYSPLTLAVANKVKADTMAELIALSKTVPKKMNYASAGVGSVAHLTWEVIRDGAGIDTVHVPYKGGGQAMGDLIAGHVDLNMAAVSVAKPMVEGGKIKAVVVTGDQRSPALPNVPTLKGGWRQDRECRPAVLVRPVRPEGHSRSGEGQDREGGRYRHGVVERACPPGQARHHARFCARHGASPQACERNHQLDEIYRFPRHQAGVS